MEPRQKKRKVAASGEEPRCVVDDVPDDLLRQILLRLDSPLWLLRAACACKRWRRVVTGGDDADGGRAFLRLARSLHPPVVVGHYHTCCGGGYSFKPSSSPTPIRLSLDFVDRELVKRHHNIHRWEVADCHGGLVLLRDGLGRVSDLVVCDPLSRRHRNILHPPNQTTCQQPGSYIPRVFLLDGGGDDGDISISNFRVLLYHTCFDHDDGDDDITKVYAFSAGDGGGWRLVRQSTAASDDDDDLCVGSYKAGYVIGRIDRSLYLASSAGSVRVLDNANARLVFSEVHLPIRVSDDYGYDSKFAVVHRASTEPCTASPATAYIVHVCGEGLELFRRIPSSGEWVLEHSIPQASFGLARGSRSCWSWLFSLGVVVDAMQQQVMVPDVTFYYISHKRKPISYTLPWPQFLTAVAS